MTERQRQPRRNGPGENMSKQSKKSRADEPISVSQRMRVYQVRVGEPHETRGGLELYCIPAASLEAACKKAHEIAKRDWPNSKRVTLYAGVVEGTYCP